VEGDQRVLQVRHGLDGAVADLHPDQLGGGAGQRVVGLVGNGWPARMVAPGALVPDPVQPGEVVQRRLDPLDRRGPAAGMST